MRSNTFLANLSSERERESKREREHEREREGDRELERERECEPDRSEKAHVGREQVPRRRGPSGM